MYAPTIYVVLFAVLYIPILIALAYGVSAGRWQGASVVFIIVAVLLTLLELDSCTDTSKQVVHHCTRYRCSHTARTTWVWCADLIGMMAIGAGFYVIRSTDKTHDLPVGTLAGVCDLLACSIHLRNHLVLFDPLIPTLVHADNDVVLGPLSDP